MGGLSANECLRSHFSGDVDIDIEIVPRVRSSGKFLESAAPLGTVGRLGRGATPFFFF